jgi:hypothetical protein
MQKLPTDMSRLSLVHKTHDVAKVQSEKLQGPFTKLAFILVLQGVNKA